MATDSFADLLSIYMRRIRASASGVATEIGLSREAVNNWRNGVSAPNPRSRDRVVACTRYLRLTESNAPSASVAPRSLMPSMALNSPRDISSPLKNR